MKLRKTWILASALMVTLGLAIVLPIARTYSAGPTIVVTPTNQQGWSTADTRPGGTVSFVVDSSAPSGVGALQLTTDATTAAKAQYLHAASIPLADVNDLSYYTRQVNAPLFPGADPSYQLIVCLAGVTPSGCAGFTTFVFEPYENPGLGTPGGVVIPDAWQKWNVSAGQFWSSRSYTDGGSCTVVAGAGGAPFYPLAVLKTMCPNAVVEGFGVNIGSNNPSYNVYTDLFNFNGTTYDFEPYEVATNKDQCKNGGYVNAKRADGSSFKNQGDCIQYVNTGK